MRRNLLLLLLIVGGVWLLTKPSPQTIPPPNAAPEATDTEESRLFAERQAARERQAEEERAAQKRQAEEERAARQREEDARCSTDLKCFGEKHWSAASVKCEPRIERLAKYNFEWTDKWYQQKLSHFSWHNRAKGMITYLGDKIKFQNGFGAWAIMLYECDFDASTGTVLEVRAEPGRLPNGG
jgi:hypothetical protein